MTRLVKKFRVYLCRHLRKSAFSSFKNLKIHEIFFALLVVLLPIQLGKHFWPDWSYVWGLRIDYLSPTVYLTDLLVLGIVFFWFLENRNHLGGGAKLKAFLLRGGTKKKLLLPISISAFLLLNAFLSQNQPASFYKLIKILEFALLGFYVSRHRNLLPVTCYLLPLAVAYSSLIAIAQFIKQASIGGFFYWLGERTFSVVTPGIAKAVINGQLVLRPYATFPHPNVLAGFILISLVLILQLRRKLKTPRRWKQSYVFFLRGEALAKFLFWFTFLVGLVTIALSFSRSVWLMGCLIGFYLLWKYFLGKMKKRTPRRWGNSLATLLRGGTVLALSLGILGMFGLLGKGLSSDGAISQRLDLAKASVGMIKEYLWVGVGLNNFIVRLPEYWSASWRIRFLQPVHNIYLLVAAETGLAGLLVFLWFLVLTIKKQLEILNYKLLIPILVILLLGLTDHYWLTLQQTQLLMVIVLGLSWNKDIAYLYKETFLNKKDKQRIEGEDEK
jgi:hypothetical protein